MPPFAEAGVAHGGASAPLSEQVQAMTGKPQRLIRVFLFCDTPNAVQMVDGSIDFAASLPCRITLVEQDQWQLWLVMMNLRHVD
ncbi:MAG: DUF302 domain-containing protein [Thiomonas sp.]|nr:DUF302 domain-containing protein [Thiomonas sp.]